MIAALLPDAGHAATRMAAASERTTDDPAALGAINRFISPGWRVLGLIGGEQ